MVITSVYDRCGNHYCFPAGLLNQKKCRGGEGGFISVSGSPGKMKLSRATQHAGGGKGPFISSDLRDRNVQGHRDDNRDMAGAGGDTYGEGTEMVRHRDIRDDQREPTDHPHRSIRTERVGERFIPTP